MTSRSAELQWRTALHEAGHLLADSIFRFGPWEVDLDTPRGGSTFSCVVAPTNLEEKVNLATSLFCGAAAERAAGFDDAETQKGQASDEAKINALGLSANEIRSCSTKADELMLRFRERVQRIAKVLNANTVTRGAALYELLEEEIPPGRWFGRVEVVGAPVSNAVVTFDGEFENGIEVESFIVTATNAESARRLAALAGHQDLLITGFGANGESCGGSIREVRARANLQFELIMYSSVA
ncbi:MAG: hypothetical protein QM817_40775 [Archangium sp.]